MEILDSQAFTELVVLLWDIANWILMWKQASKGALQAIRLYLLVKSKGVIVAEPEIGLKGQISRGYATQKVLIREAKNYAAVASVVGICKHSALGVEEHSLKIQSLFWLFKLV
ncbi:hypothetical protein V6N13_098519 [Hibiscus sabdariffa]